MQTLRSILIYIVAIPVFIIVGLLLIFLAILLPSIKHRFAYMASTILLFFMGIRVRKNGLFPDTGHYIVMTNHSTFVDPILMPQVMKGKYTGIAADYNFRYPVWAQLLRRFNVIEIDRSNHEKAVETITHAERVINELGFHVAIFPEGTRTVTGKMGPLKKGGFHMAINTGVPILPVGIRGGYRFKPKKRFTIRPGEISIHIGKPIPATEYADLGVNGLLKRVEAELQKLSGELDHSG